ncbi:unnamed protein product, partial [Ectocarpus sp. 12 AP-2014]
HSGWVGEFSLSMPLEFERGYAVPYLSARYQGDDYLDHYFGVRLREGEAPSIPEYNPPDDATSYRLGIRGTYRLNDIWVLTGSARLDFLDGAIENSPLVDTDMTAAFSLGVAYN